MFEVGKKYKSDGNATAIYECLYVNSEGWLYQCYNPHKSTPPAWRQFSSDVADSIQWSKLPPEPKRWSEWVNFYPTWNYCSYFPHSSLERAMDKKTNSECVGTIRFDWEQEEGKEKRLVKTELLGVSD